MFSKNRDYYFGSATSSTAIGVGSSSSGDRRFYTAVAAVHAKTVKPFEVVTKDGTVRFYIHVDVDPIADAFTACQNDMNGDGIRCRDCDNFFMRYAGLVGPEDNAFTGCEGIYGMVAGRIAGCRPVQSKITVLDRSSDVFGVPSSGGFQHFALNVPEAYRSDASVDVSMIKRGIHHHYPVLRRIFTEMGSEEGILDSLDLTIELLGTVPYGDRLIASATWFRENIAKWIAVARGSAMEKNLVVIEALIPVLEKGLDHEVNCPALSQFNKNTRSVMEKAHDVDAFKKMVAERMDPSNYARPTTAPTALQVERAIEMLEDRGFMNTLMPLDHIPSVGGILFNKYSRSKSAGSQLAALRDTGYLCGAGGDSRARSAAGFASRAGRAGGASVPRTLHEFVKDLTPDDKVSIKVCQGNTPVMVSRYSNNATEMFIPGHTADGYLWSFANGDGVPSHGPSIYGFRTGWAKCSAVLKLGERSYFFGIEGATPKRGMKNNCYPEFLNSAHMRHYRKAFEALNKHDINIDEDAGPFALGIGYSRLDKTGELHQTVTVKKNGTCYTFSKY